MAEHGAYYVSRPPTGNTIIIPIGSGDGVEATPGRLIEIAVDWGNGTGTTIAWSYTGGTPTTAPTARVAWSAPGAGSVTSGVWTWVVESGITAITLTFGGAADNGNAIVSVFSGVTSVKVQGSAPAWAGANAGSASSGTIASVAANSVVHAGVSIASGSEVVSMVTAGGTEVWAATERKGYVARWDQASSGTVAAKSFSWANATAYRPRAWAIAYEMPVAPVLLDKLISGVHSSGFTVGCRTQNTGASNSVRLKVATNVGMSSGVVYGSYVTPDGSGWSLPKITGLSGNSSYYVQVEMLDSVGATSTSAVLSATAVKTLGTPGVPTNRTIGMGSCYDIATTQTGTDPFTRMNTRGVDLVWTLGDMGYDDETSTSQAVHLADIQAVINASTGYRTALAHAGVIPIKSDHDAGPNNSFAGTQTPANRGAMLQVYDFGGTRPDSDALYHSVVDGRVRYIFLDTRYLSVEDVTRLGNDQMDWFEAELLEPEPSKIVVMDNSPLDNRSPTGPDRWSNYPTELAALNAAMDAAVGHVTVVHGDQHALAMDDGSNPLAYGRPIVCAAALRMTSSHKTANPLTDWSEGIYPTTETVTISQYVYMETVDTGSEITHTFTGYDSTDTNRMSLVVEIPTPIAIAGTVAVSSATAGEILSTVKLAGTSASVSALYGAIAINARLSGQANVVSASAGGLTSPVSGFSGTAAAGAQVVGAILAKLIFGGQANAVSSSWGRLTTAGGGLSPEEGVRMSNNDLEKEYLQGTGTLADEREQIYGPNEHAYFAGLSGLVPASKYSINDHKRAYYSSQTGLTVGSLADLERAFWEFHVG